MLTGEPSPCQLTIREVLPDEAYEYTECQIDCWQEAYKGLMPDDYLRNMHAELDQRAEHTRKTLLQPGDTKFYCVKIGEKTIGRLIFGKSRDEDKPDAGEIHAIYLRAEFWDKGYGRQIMNVALEALRLDGYKEIVVWVFEENDRAIRFYEKNGFIFDGTKQDMEVGKVLIAKRFVLGLD